MNSLGLISVLYLIISLLYVEIKWGPVPGKTFSRLVAQKKSSIIFYFITFTIFLSLFSLFVVEIFTPELKLPIIFLWVFFISVISQFICVTVPETGGYKTRVHIASASVMSVSTFLQIILIITYAHLSLLGIIISSLSLSIMLAIWIIVLTNHRLVNNELAIQAVYFACYLGTILFVFYIK